MIKFIKEEDKLWEELKPLIPVNKQPYSNDVHFINSILTLLKERDYNRLENGLNWKLITPPSWRSSYNRRFNRWRNDGVWENLLLVLVKYEKFDWLANPYIYSYLFKNYKLLNLLNSTYVLSLPESELTEQEIISKLKINYPTVMRNRNRRIKTLSQNKKSRGAYKNTYSSKEQEVIKSLEYGENDIDV